MEKSFNGKIGQAIRKTAERSAQKVLEQNSFQLKKVRAKGQRAKGAGVGI